MLEKDRIDEMIEAVMKVARGDYSAQIELSGKNDELDSLAMGLNMMIDDIRNENTERKQAEEALRKSEEKYRILIENATDFIYMIDKNNRVLSLNKAASFLFRKQPKEIIGKSIFELFPKEIAAGYSKNIKKMFDTGKSDLYVSKMIAGGRELWLSVSLNPVCDREGKVVSVMGVGRDITEQKKMEEALQKKTHDFGERLKELSCLYGIDEICRREGVTIDEVLKETVRLMPPSWQYSEVAGSHISYGKKEYKTENFKVTQWKQRADLIVNNKKYGLVEVCYLEEKPEIDEGPFLKEERDLINAVAERLSQFIGHRQAEVDLKNSEERYKDLVEKAGIAILIDDEKGEIIYANQKAEELYGYSLKELKNQSIQSLVHPDDIKKVTQFHNNRLRGKEVPSRYEFKGIKKDGSIIYVELDVVELKDKERAVGTRMYLKDITERKKAEEEMRIKDSAIESSINAIAIASLEGSLTFVNNSFLKMWGYDDEEEVIGKPAAQFWQMEEKAGKVMESLRNKGSWIGELAAKQKDGSQFDVQLSSTVVADENGRPICVMGSFLDISDQKKAAEELKDSEERLKIIFEYAPDGYYLNDFKGNFIDGNIAATKLVGYKKEELIGKSFLKLKLLSAQDIPKAAASLARNILGKSTGPDEYILNRGDGKQTAVEIRTYPVKIKGKTIILGNVRDINERKKAEEQIKKSLKEKEVLLKEIHHRVKNNMQIISSLLNIQASNIEDENVREMFNVSQGRIRSMALMHETLYKSEDLARIDFSEYIRRLTTHLMSVYRVGIEPIRLNLDIVDVYLDINRAIPCGMIISELVSNSLKHAFPDGKAGEIAVKMFTDKKKKVTLIVRDTGAGFPEGLDFRETKSMGMQLVTDLTRQIKGTIKIGRDKGTEFKIVF